MITSISLSTREIDRGSPPSSRRRQLTTGQLRLVFQILAGMTKRHTPTSVCLRTINPHFRYRHLRHYRPDLVATILSSTERIVIGSHQFLNWWQQHATGMLHLRSSNLGRDDKKDTHRMMCVFFGGTGQI